MSGFFAKGGKPKFNKDKCLKCVYRLEDANGFLGKNERGEGISCMCNYAGVTGHTCLHTVKGQTKDRRGEDYEDCKLFSEGNRLPTECHDFIS